MLEGKIPYEWKLEVLVFSKWRKGWNTSVQTSSFSLCASVLPEDLCKCRSWILPLQMAASWATNNHKWFMLTRNPILLDHFPSEHVRAIRILIRKIYCCDYKTRQTFRFFLHGWVLYDKNSKVVCKKEFVLFLETLKGW